MPVIPGFSPDLLAGRMALVTGGAGGDRGFLST